MRITSKTHLTETEYRAECAKLNEEFMRIWSRVLTLRSICPISLDFTSAIDSGSKALAAIDRAQDALRDMQFVGPYQPK